MKKYIRKFLAAFAVLATTVVSTLLWTGEAADVKAQNTANPSQDTTLPTQAPKQEAPEIIEVLTEKGAMQAMADDAKAEMAEAAAAMRTEIIPLSQKITEKDLIARGVSPYDAYYVLRDIVRFRNDTRKIKGSGTLIFMFREGEKPVILVERGVFKQKLYGETIKEESAPAASGIVSDSVQSQGVGPSEAVPAAKAEEVTANKIEETGAPVSPAKVEPVVADGDKITQAESEKTQKIAKEEARKKSRAEALAKAEQKKKEKAEALAAAKAKKEEEHKLAKEEKAFLGEMNAMSGDEVRAYLAAVAKEKGWNHSTERLRRGENVRDLLERLGISSRQIKKVMKVFNWHCRSSEKLPVGHEFEVVADKNGGLYGFFMFEKDTPNQITVYRSPKSKSSDPDFGGKKEVLPTTEGVQLVVGTIPPSHNFYQAMVREGASPALVNQVVGIFSQWIDLSKVTTEDSFRVLTSAQYLKDGRKVGGEVVESATMTINGTPYEAHRVPIVPGQVYEYFNQYGMPLSRFQDFIPGAVVTGVFGEDRGDHYHKGIDFRGGTGTPFYAPTGCVITKIGNAEDGYDYKVVANGGQGLTIIGAHLLPGSVPPVGTVLKAGDKMGEVGPKGPKSSASHLHGEMRQDGRPFDFHKKGIRDDLDSEGMRILAKVRCVNDEKIAELVKTKENLAVEEAACVNQGGAEEMILVVAADQALSSAIMEEGMVHADAKEAIETVVPPGISPVQAFRPVSLELVEKTHRVDADLSSDYLIVGTKVAEAFREVMRERTARRTPPVMLAAKKPSVQGKGEAPRRIVLATNYTRLAGSCTR